jgi:hypothetical protein
MWLVPQARTVPRSQPDLHSHDAYSVMKSTTILIYHLSSHLRCKSQQAVHILHDRTLCLNNDIIFMRVLMYQHLDLPPQTQILHSTFSI